MVNQSVLLVATVITTPDKTQTKVLQSHWVTMVVESSTESLLILPTTSVVGTLALW